MDFLQARSPLTVRAAPAIGHSIRHVAAGRPLRIGFASTVVRGWTMGDLTLDFGAEHVKPSDIEVFPVGDVPVAIDRRLIAVLRRGASIRRRLGLTGPRFTIALDHPEDWLDFLDGRPIAVT